MLTRRVSLATAVYTAAAIAKTTTDFSGLCTAQLDGYVVTITAACEQTIDEFLNYALCLSAQEQL